MAIEKEIRAAIRKYLQVSGWFVFGVWQGYYSHKGISDLIAVRDGLVLFIEVKTDRGRQSPDQIQFERDVREKGGHYFVARSIEDVDGYIASVTGEKNLIFA